MYRAQIRFLQEEIELLSSSQRGCLQNPGVAWTSTYPGPLSHGPFSSSSSSFAAPPSNKPSPAFSSRPSAWPPLEAELAFAAWRTTAWRERRAREADCLARATESESASAALLAELTRTREVCEGLVRQNAGLESRAQLAEELWEEAQSEQASLEERLELAEQAAERAAKLAAEAARAGAEAMEEVRRLEEAESCDERESDGRGS